MIGSSGNWVIELVHRVQSRDQFPNQLPNYPITRLPDSRPPAAIGRRARLELVFARRGGRTVVAHAYAEPPLRVGPTFDIDDAVYVIVVCTGPGVFGGDALSVRVTVEPGARAILTSQSALQAHPGGGVAMLEQVYRVAHEGELHCHWDPLIPFAGARVAQRFEIQADEGSRVYWSDALMSGRTSRGEMWRFDELRHDLALRAPRAGYRERFRIRPAERDPTRRWIAGAANYFATLVVHDARVGCADADDLHRLLAEESGAAAGADLLGEGLLVARLTAASGPPFARARAAARAFTLDRIFHAPQFAGRK